MCTSGHSKQAAQVAASNAPSASSNPLDPSPGGVNADGTINDATADPNFQSQESALASDPTKDTTANQAQLQGDARQTNIANGRSAIDNAFSQFDDNYFNNYGNTYEQYYDPQVDNQYSLANQKQTYDSARKGVLDSTPAIAAAGRLSDAYLNQRQKIGSDAIGAVNTVKNNIETQKQNLYSLNQNAADPAAAGAQAAAAAGTIPTQPQYSVLGDLFSGLINSGAGYISGQTAGQTLPNYKVPTIGAGLPTGAGSGRIVG